MLKNCDIKFTFDQFR